MKLGISPRAARRIAWTACFILVFVSAFFLSGTEAPPLALDPSWHVALEYAAVHHWQFGTQVVFTFGPLGFLAARTSLGHLIGARIAFAFFWSALVALAAMALAKRLSGWIRYAFVAWLVVFTLSEGLDQAAFFLMAYGVLLLLIDSPEQRWQQPLFVFAFIVLSLIKLSFLTAAFASLILVLTCWMWQRKIVNTAVLVLAAPSGFIAFWMALGQAVSHLAPWLRHGLELESGYSAAMNLVPKTAVLVPALVALALFVAALIATVRRSRRNLLAWAALTTLAQYVFLSWKEGFTRSGDWHVYVFLWFLPLGWAFCFRTDLWGAPTNSQRWMLNATFAAGMVLCLLAGNFQIRGFASRQAADWPWRASHNARAIVAALRGRSQDLYTAARDPANLRMLNLDHAKDVIGNASVDVMNYLAVAAVANEMNYQPRPVIQGFVAYTPALQTLNEEYFRAAGRPQFVMLCQEATDGRFPALEDSGALNYVLNNYVPVARDGRFLVLQQRTGENPAFQLVHTETQRFGQKVNLSPWAHGPLFMSFTIAPSLLGRAATLLYQQQPLYLHVSGGVGDERYRLVPSMAEQPFLISPVLNSNADIIRFDALHSGHRAESVTFERSPNGLFEFQDQLTVRLYTAPGFPRAAREIPPSRMLADVEGRVFWPDPVSVASATPARITIFHGTPGLAVHAPSKIVLEIPEHASSFFGYFGVPQEAYPRARTTGGVEVSIVLQNRSGAAREVFHRFLQPLSRAADRGRFAFSIPIDGARDRRVILATGPEPSGADAEGWLFWSQCRFDTSSP